jgi:hypothetical protein
MSNAHRILVRMMHILNLIYQSQILNTGNGIISHALLPIVIVRNHAPLCHSIRQLLCFLQHPIRRIPLHHRHRSDRWHHQTTGGLSDTACTGIPGEHAGPRDNVLHRHSIKELTHVVAAASPGMPVEHDSFDIDPTSSRDRGGVGDDIRCGHSSNKARAASAPRGGPGFSAPKEMPTWTDCRGRRTCLTKALCRRKSEYQME